MNYVIILFYTATIVAGIIIVINPEMVFGLIRKNLDSLGMHILAVVVRAIIRCSTNNVCGRVKIPDCGFNLRVDYDCCCIRFWDNGTY